MTFKDLTKQLVPEDRFDLLERYFNMIEEKNAVMNLTGFSGDRLWQEGIYESIYVLIKAFGKVENKNILDIGAGAGFPSVPYLIAFPNNSLTIYEPKNKRTLFLESVKEELNLNIDIKNIRAEESNEKNKFDLITARAVASFKVLAEISHSPAKIGAKFGFMKGPKVHEEVKESSWIINRLKISPEIIKIDTEGRDNYVISYLKEEETPVDIPREWRVIVK